VAADVSGVGEHVMDKTPSSETIRNIAVAATSAIPLAGGPLSIILDKYLPSELQQRRNALLDQMAQDLENVKDLLSPTRLASPEFLSLFIKVLRGAMEEHRKEKITAFRNILVNTAFSAEGEFDETDFFLRVLDDLTVDQIRILHVFYEREVFNSTTTHTNLYDQIMALWPGVDRDYLKASASELFRLLLISTSASSSVNESKQSRGTHALTRFGERFVGLIFSPIEMENTFPLTQAQEDGPSAAPA
jgi:hypothetical protein